MINYILYINSKGNMVLLKKNVSGFPVYSVFDISESTLFMHNP